MYSAAILGNNNPKTYFNLQIKTKNMNLARYV